MYELDYAHFYHIWLIEQATDKPVPNATLQVTGAVGWRREGLVYKKNEVVSSSHYAALKYMLLLLLGWTNLDFSIGVS